PDDARPISEPRGCPRKAARNDRARPRRTEEAQEDATHQRLAAQAARREAPPRRKEKGPPHGRLSEAKRQRSGAILTGKGLAGISGQALSEAKRQRSGAILTGKGLAGISGQTLAGVAYDVS